MRRDVRLLASLAIVGLTATPAIARMTSGAKITGNIFTSATVEASVNFSGDARCRRIAIRTNHLSWTTPPEVENIRLRRSGAAGPALTIAVVSASDNSYDDYVPAGTTWTYTASVAAGAWDGPLSSPITLVQPITC